MTGRRNAGRARPAREPAPKPARRLGAARDGSAHGRFLAVDRARALREWDRYEGTAQRDLFRQLRERFLQRNAADGEWVLDVGSGPGRFTWAIGRGKVRRVGIDLSVPMLEVARERSRPFEGALRADQLRADALSPPFAPRTFDEVAAIGNALGFEARAGTRFLAQVEELVVPGGTLIVEVAPGPGERSRYLGRLPATAVRRLLAAPTVLVASRVRREGFGVEPERHRSEGFRRWTVDELKARWERSGWSVQETVAVAPALGADPDRLTAIAADPAAWLRLLELEETLGREPARYPSAAAVLLAARRGH